MGRGIVVASGRSACGADAASRASLVQAAGERISLTNPARWRERHLGGGRRSRAPGDAAPNPLASCASSKTAVSFMLTKYHAQRSVKQAATLSFSSKNQFMKPIGITLSTVPALTLGAPAPAR